MTFVASDTSRNMLSKTATLLVDAGERPPHETLEASRTSVSKVLQLGAIARATPWSIVSHLINTTIVLVAFQTSVPSTQLLLWSICSYAVGFWVLHRAINRARRKRSAANLNRQPKPRSIRKNVVVGALLAAPWGVLAIWLLGRLPQHQELVLVTVSAGMAAGGAMLLSAAVPAAITFMALILGPVALKCFLLGTSEYALVGALSLSYALFLLTAIKSNAKLFADKGNALDQLAKSLLNAEEARRDIEHFAMHDALTGLANRRAFLNYANCERQDNFQHHALLYIDLDHFKPVNDNFGHEVGDKLLQAVAGRLCESAGRQALIARLGGDEFAVLIPDASESAKVEETAGRMLARLCEPYDINGRTVSIGASIGLALAGSPPVADITQFLKMADLALYKAKQRTEYHCSCFEPAMLEEMKQRNQIEDALRFAVTGHQLELYFQPIIDLVALKVVGAEALIRWNHPQLGLVLPGDFLQVAEKIHLLPEIEDWTLEEACRQATLWPEPLTVAVNVSPGRIEHADIAANVASVLGKTGLRAERLEIEVTESAILSNDLDVRRKLTELKALGVSLAMDDFGTGYSSLSYLSRFPFDRIKIDRSFVHELQTKRTGASIVRATADMARDLDLNTTAEGIETPAQLAALSKLGIEQGQGYLFSKPLSAGDFAAFLLRGFTCGYQPFKLPAKLSDPCVATRRRKRLPGGQSR